MPLPPVRRGEQGRFSRARVRCCCRGRRCSKTHRRTLHDTRSIRRDSHPSGISAPEESSEPHDSGFGRSSGQGCPFASGVESVLQLGSAEALRPLAVTPPAFQRRLCGPQAPLCLAALRQGSGRSCGSLVRPRERSTQYSHPRRRPEEGAPASWPGPLSGSNALG